MNTLVKSIAFFNEKAHFYKKITIFRANNIHLLRKNITV